jgi:hypothetical protein
MEELKIFLGMKKAKNGQFLFYNSDIGQQITCKYIAPKYKQLKKFEYSIMKFAFFIEISNFDFS